MLQPILALGTAELAGDLVLRRLCKAKQVEQALIVMDYTAQLGGRLSRANTAGLTAKSTLWLDLAHKVKPVAIFRLVQGEHLHALLMAWLRRCAKEGQVVLSLACLQAVAQLATQLCSAGTVGLVALATSLRRPELTAALRQDARIAAELDACAGLLEWMLRFPAVWALSESNNVLDLAAAVRTGSVLWLTLPQAYLQPSERRLVGWMAELAVAQAVWGNTKESAFQVPLMLSVLPPSLPLGVELGVCMRQVAVLGFDPARPLHSAAATWLAHKADVWVVGPVHSNVVSDKHPWLPAEQCQRVQQLQAGQVWVISGKSQKGVTALVKHPAFELSVSQSWQHLTLGRLAVSPTRQFGWSPALAATSAHQGLYEKLASPDMLLAGWMRVRQSQKYSHGIDRVTVEQFGTALDSELLQLAGELREMRYIARPLRTIRLPKPDGDTRLIKVACVRDRVVQAAFLHLVEPLFDARMSPRSFAYRPGRSAHHALALARSAIHAGKHWAVVADIKKCFDSIDHDILMRLFGDVVSDRPMLRQLRQWLQGDVVDFGALLPTELGVSQGEVISPLLANIYLDPMDKEFERSGVNFVRYADDYLVLCDTSAQAQAVLAQMRDFLQSALQLQLKPAKTMFCHLDDGVVFLGVELTCKQVRIPAAKLLEIQQGAFELVDLAADEQANSVQKFRAVEKLGARIRGVRNYFYLDAAPIIAQQLQGLDAALDAYVQSKWSDALMLDLMWTRRERFMLPGSGAADTADTAMASLGLYAADAAPLGDAPDLHRTQLAGQPPPVPTIHTPLTGLQRNDDDQSVFYQTGQLHVMKGGCYVTMQGDDVVIKRKRLVLAQHPIAQLELLYLEGRGIAISADLTMLLAQRDVAIVVAPLVGLPSAMMLPIQSQRSHIRQLQVLRKSDQSVMRCGVAMLAAKVANQASVLKYFARYRKKTDETIYLELTRCADAVREVANLLEGLDAGAVQLRATAMGLEGRAASMYWQAFSLLVPEQHGFTGRHTRHATDPVNSLLNYCYGLLYGRVWQAIVKEGLDPYFGIMHGSQRDQGSLVFDVIEEFRGPFADRVVLGLLGRGFDPALDKDGLLKSAVRVKLAAAFFALWNKSLRWNDRNVTPAALLQLQVAQLRKMYEKGDGYRAFRFRW